VELLQALLAPGDRAWIVPVPGHASWSRQTLVAALPGLADSLREAPDLPAGITAAASEVAAGVEAVGHRLIVAGSLYLIGALLSDERQLAAGH
jgi:dihydrofolate synthase/folylpolyglutamate synthase